MSLQMLNDEVQTELVERQPPRGNPVRGAIQRLRTNRIGTLMKGEYPSSKRLEELLLESEYE